MHVILSYFTHELSVACADFKNLSGVSIFMNQYLIFFISNAKIKNFLDSVLHKYNSCLTGKKMFVALLCTQVLE